MTPDGEPPDLLVGQILDGRYRLDERVGLGGMGSVYRAWHLMMEHRVAIKVLAAERADDPTYAKRFIREAKSTFRFDHPNCVRVSDFGATPDGILYLVMEYLDGRTVGQELHYDGPTPAQRVPHIARQVCDALGHAHELGFVHRDLKPDNLMLIRRGEDADFVKVLDFGLAKFVDESGALANNVSMSPLTRQGMVFGTPEYMSPEQASGKKLSPGTDLYSLGVVVYQMLTGLVPFHGSSFMQILTKQVKEQAIPPAKRRTDLWIPEALDRLVMWCLEKDPTRRPGSAQELGAAFADAEAALGRAISRIPAKLAASETMDLSDLAVAPMIAAMAQGAMPVTPDERPTTPVPPPHAPLAPEMSGSMRMNAAPLTPEMSGSMRMNAAPAVSQRMPAQPREATPVPAVGQAGLGAPTMATVATPPAKSSRWGAAAAVIAVFTAVAAVTVFALSMDRGGADTETKEADSAKRPGDEEPKKVADPPPTPPQQPPDAGPVAVPDGKPGDEAGATAEPVADAGSSDTVPKPAQKTAAQKTAETHIKNGKEALRSHNGLRALSEADAALELDPKNREGRILFGEALIATDQRDRGCKELKRFKRAFERAGCAD